MMIADWRTQLVVPDSDEDEDDDSLRLGSSEDQESKQNSNRWSKESNIHPNGGALQPHSLRDFQEVGAQQNVSLETWQTKDGEQGDYIQQDIQRGSPGRSGASKNATQDNSRIAKYSGILASSLTADELLDTAVSSGLSSITSSPLSSSPNSPTLASAQRSDLVVPGLDLEPELRIVSRESSRPARQFRQRKAIQLNPYAIEGQLYKQVWKSRGLVPLQVKNQSQVEQDHDSDVSSSDLEEPQSSGEVRRTFASFSNARERSVDLGYSQTHAVHDEEEFLDLQHVSRTSMQDTTVSGTKRRKLAHTYSNKNRKWPGASEPAFPVREDGWVQVPFAPGKEPARQLPTPGQGAKGLVPPTARPLQTITPQSPLPTSSASAPGSPIFDLSDNDTRLKIGRVTPAQLHTPITSSEARPRWAEPASAIKSGARARSSHFPQLTDSDEDLASGSDDESEAEFEATRQIIKAQRRTRGVLPASWHRLEYKKLIQNDSKAKANSVQATNRRRLSSKSPVKETQKGVAKRVTTTRPRSPNGKIVSVLRAISDNSEAETSVEEQQEPWKEQRNIDNYLMNNEFLTISDDDDMNMEDNRIDIMASTSNARKPSDKHRRPKKKEQTKINDTMPYSRYSGNDRDVPSRSNTRNTKTSRNVKKKPQRKNLYGIVDVAKQFTRAQTPSFIAIAARTARKRRDQGRHSPSRKHIQLQNARETQDIHETLRAWQKGGFRTRKTFQNSRQPLQERSVNQSRPQMFLSDRDDETDLDHPAMAFSARQKDKVTSSAHDAFTTTLHQKRPMRTGYPITSAIRESHRQAPAQLEIENLRSHQRERRQGKGLLLGRFLQTDSAPPQGVPSVPIDSRCTTKEPRKRIPKQAAIELETDHVATVSSGSTSRLTSKQIVIRPASGSASLTGLSLPVTDYSTTFDINHLPDGSHFSNDSIVGSGLFDQSLHSVSAHISRTPLRARFRGVDIEWSSWTESVATQIFDFLSRATSDFGSTEGGATQVHAVDVEISQSLQLIIRYLANHIRFLDPSDQQQFSERWEAELRALNQLLGSIQNSDVLNDTIDATRSELAGLVAVISNQVKRLSDQSPTTPDVKHSITSSAIQIRDSAFHAILRKGCEALRIFSRDTVNLSNHPSRSQSSKSTEVFVLLHHLFRAQEDMGTSIWDYLKKQGLLVMPYVVDVPALESSWRNMLTLLPLLEINSQGIVTKDRSNTTEFQNWKLVKQLLEPVFETYSSTEHPGAIVHYLRTLFVRCYYLLDSWGWYDCESTMTYLFDFFARNGLRDIEHGASSGSPSFLSMLSSTIQLGIRMSDRCFHVLLKFIGAGLRSMRSRRSERKIANCVWRLTPNHDRRLPKDEAVRREDLDAVRNHLDLLAVLYWAAPPDYRIRVDAIRRLIDIETSHQEVCRLVIKTWFNLVSFQLSTNEAADRLKPFLEWYDEILVKLICLHKLARSEVEADARLAEETFGQRVSKTQQERIILESQHHVETILTDALDYLKAAISRVVSPSHLEAILSLSLGDLFNLHSNTEFTSARSTTILSQVIEVLQSLTTRVKTLNEATDSQDFGDLPDFEELVPDLQVSNKFVLPAEIDKPLYRFVTRLLGSELPMYEGLVQKSIDCYLDAMSLEIRADYIEWEDLLDPHAPRSWSGLGDTAQKRRYTPFFLARLINRNGRVYERKRYYVLQEWIGSLVEQESLIKYQPLLTSTLFNQDASEPLFQNPPFWKDNGVYNITLAQFIERRLALISCLFSNMRDSLDFSLYHQLQDCHEKRKNYSNLLGCLMETLKANYQSLGNTSNSDYVVFAQAVVQEMQQHTSNIRKIDDFFTDAVNFPLPNRDPEYIQTKLRHFIPELQRNGGPQKLAAFIQTLCERAVIEAKQNHYASLLALAMADGFESGEHERMTLRHFISCFVAPIYIDTVSSTSCGWALAGTILLALPLVLQDLLLNVNSFKRASMDSMRSIVTRILDSISKSTTALLDNGSELTIQSTVILSQYFVIVGSVLDAADYYCRKFPLQSRIIMDLMFYFGRAALCILKALSGADMDLDTLELPPRVSTTQNTAPSRFDEVQRFVQTGLQDALVTPVKSKWRMENGRLMVFRNTRWEHIKTNLGDVGQQQTDLVSSIRLFLSKLASTPSFRWIAAQPEIQSIKWQIPMEGISGANATDQLSRVGLLSYL